MDTKASRSTHPPASTNHNRFGLILDQSKLLTSMLQNDQHLICPWDQISYNITLKQPKLLNGTKISS